MSLTELLNNPDDSSPWRIQRTKALRLVAGIGVLAIVLVIVAYIVSSHGDTRASENAQALAQLMNVQKEAQGLRADLNNANRGPSSAPTSVGTANTDSAQIYDFDPGDGFAPIQKQQTEVYVPTGAVFLAQLITPIKTSVERTFVMAETTREFRMDDKRRILKGSRLIGRSRLNPVLKGVVVEFDTLVSPSGIESSLSGLALSRNALPELEGLYFSNRLETYGTALAFGFLGGFANASREREPTILGSQPQVNLTNEVLAGVSTASFQVAEDILREVRERAIEYVVVPAGEQVFVALTRRYDINQGARK
jgi:hypothetical protein